MSFTGNIWDGVFTSWDQAAIAASAANLDAISPYDSKRWIDRQQSMLEAARSGVVPRPTNLPLAVSMAGAHTVIDLGGGSGWTYEVIARGNNAKVDKYYIIERQSSIHAFSALFPEPGIVQYLGDNALPEALLNSVDVLYSNSALQYFPNNDFLINLISRCTPIWILLDDFQVALSGQFFSLQHYYGSEIPCRFTDVVSTIREIEELGYTVQGNWEYQSGNEDTAKKFLGKDLQATNAVAPSRSLLFKAS